PLERLPLTLGKLAGHVDFLLRDESVSRIHAHISKNESGQVCIRDLNSTNGTFLNGIRLVPNETVSIREGDEVCFGDMVFEYL
ncbi:MAG: FHA domain-containing protein, partial [Lachnospiraceae bacterium]|nr:FHA domain-containing protein [Lachnospiraceae bacterium]